VKLGYLSQHADELGAGGTVLEAAQRATGLTPNKARALLGQFLFSGEDAEKPLDGLSGGERRRLSLAILVSSGANLLVIDEPTNHLDLESREALEDALRGFDGTVLLVSHDRALLDAVGTRTLAIEDRKLASYLGGWAEYARVREEREEPPPPPKEKKEKPRPEPGQSKNRQKRIAQLEREVEQAEAALKQLEDELADPAAWASPTGSERSAKRHAQAKGRIESLYDELLTLSEE
jgi:ATP-binding cassette subfamily F protein 3